VRRGLAGLLFFVAALLFAIAGGGWWLQRVAFDPGVSRDVADAVYDDPELRREVATLVATAAADRLGQPADQLGTWIEANFPAMLRDSGVRAVLRDVIGQAHGKLIGERSEPVQVTGQQMVEIVRNENVFDLPAVVIPVEEISWLSTVRATLAWLVPITAIAGLLVTVLGIIAHPNRADAVFGIGVFCIVAAVLAFLLGYLVPAYGIPALTDEAWSSLIPAVADARVGVVGSLSVGLAILGCVLVFASAGVRRRKTKGWSSPVRPTRYRTEQRQWSR
jgi:hypothetical protein